MGNHKVSCLVFACGLVAVTAQADHNSIRGEGWWNPPNDIHNPRIETIDDGADGVVDFMRMDGGSETANVHSLDTDSVGGGDQRRAGRHQADTRGGRG